MFQSKYADMFSRSLSQHLIFISGEKKVKDTTVEWKHNLTGVLAENRKKIFLDKTMKAKY